METHFFLVRHGETDFNLKGIVQGRGVDTPLNTTGIRQATALASRFAADPPDIVVSSPLSRAKQTAKRVADACGILEIESDSNLEELSWGVFEGQPQSDELAAVFDEMKRRWHQGDLDYGVEKGESLRDVQTRGLKAIDRVLNRYAGKRVLLVTHGRFLRILLASLLAEYGIVRMEELRHSNTGVNHLVHDGHEFCARLLNCTEHLVGAL